jgi:hypothetical protein
MIASIFNPIKTEKILHNLRLHESEMYNATYLPVTNYPSAGCLIRLTKALWTVRGQDNGCLVYNVTGNKCCVWTSRRGDILGICSQSDGKDLWSCWVSYFDGKGVRGWQIARTQLRPDWRLTSREMSCCKFVGCALQVRPLIRLFILWIRYHINKRLSPDVVLS